MRAVVGADARAALSAYGKSTIAKGSKSFALASLLFGKEMQADAHMLYAWCRHCDDVIDGQVLGGDAPDAAMSAQERMRRLEGLRRDTARGLAGERTGVPAFDAFGDVAHRRHLPAKYPFDLLDGFALDASSAHYETLDDTLRYCYGVAGVVGVMMAIIMGVPCDDEETLDRACDLGLAFQLTNICRDVFDDARAGRVYLPKETLVRSGSPHEAAAIASAGPTDAIWRAAVATLDMADAYYASASLGVRRLPPRAAAAVAAARNIYRDIGGKIRSSGPDIWRERIRVSGPRKAALAALGLATGLPASFVLRNAHAAPRAGLWNRSIMASANAGAPGP